METTYTVNEMENSVEVCVNLTEPMIDIRDETVNVFVVDEQTFVNGTPCSSVRASELALIDVTYNKCFYQVQMYLFSVRIKCWKELTMHSS